MSIPDADNLTVRDASILLLMALMGRHLAPKLTALSDDQLRDTMIAVTAYIRQETRTHDVEH